MRDSKKILKLILIRKNKSSQKCLNYFYHWNIIQYFVIKKLEQNIYNLQLIKLVCKDIFKNLKIYLYKNIADTF